MAWKKTPLALALALTYPTLVHAQAGPSTDITLPTVTITASTAPYNAVTSSSATKTDAPLRDIPQTVNVVPLALLRD